MIDASLLLAAAVPVILAPMIAALTKTLLSHRKRDIEIKFKSGERLHLKVDAAANEEQIRNLIRQDEQVKKAAKTPG